MGTSPCFSNVEGKTRSSTSFTAELKDFAGPFGFDVCKLKVKKTATPTISKVGDSVTYNYNITNNGAITLFKKSIIDSRFGTLAANCGASLSPGAFCSFSIVHVVNATDPDPIVNLVTVTYNNKADFTGTDLVRTDTQTVDLVHPSFTISKDCNPKKVAPSQTVTYTIFVNNTSPDVGLVPFSVVDSLLGNITGNFNSLSAGATQTVTKTRTVLANDPHLLNNTVTATYTLDPSTKLPNKIIHSASCTVEVLRSVVKVTGFGYTNTPSTPIPDRSGIVSGTATFTVKVMNFGPATAVLNGNVTASVTKTSGSFSCTGGLKKDITGSVISGGSAEFSLVCTYTDLHDGAKVQADLLLDYTVEGAGGPRFQASGSPASVSFTIQSD